MSARPASSRRVVALLVGLVPVLASYNNVVLTALPGYPHSYVPANLAATGLALLAARGAGLTTRELGLAAQDALPGLRLGAAAALAVAAGYVLALALPATRPLLADARLAGLGSGAVAFDVLVRIPLGTVLWEEVAFRGVLLAALVRWVAMPWALAASAVLFGIWHIRPTAEALADNGLAQGPAAAAAVAAAVGFTAVAGALFAVLRLRSGSLLAPALLHLATNNLGTLAGVAAHRLAGT